MHRRRNDPEPKNKTMVGTKANLLSLTKKRSKKFVDNVLIAINEVGIVNTL